MGKIYAILSKKGGVGKTTVVINLGAAFAERGHKVLLVDVDPQNSLYLGIGLYKDKIDRGSFDILLKNVKPEEVIRSTPYRNIDVIPSGPVTPYLEWRISSVSKNLDRLKNWFEYTGVKDRYDYILIDTPPTFNSITGSAVVSSDAVMITVQSEPLAYRTLPAVFVFLRDIKEKLKPSLRVLGIIINMYDGREELMVQTARVLEEKYKNIPFKTRIPKDLNIAEALAYGKPVIFHEPGSAGARAFRLLAKEIKARETVLEQVIKR